MTEFNIAQYLTQAHAEEGEKMASLIQDAQRAVVTPEKPLAVDASKEIIPLAQRLAKDANENIISLAINNQQSWLAALNTLRQSEQYRDIPEAQEALRKLQETLTQSMLPDQFKQVVAEASEQDGGKERNEKLEAIAASARELAMVRFMKACDEGRVRGPATRETVDSALGEYLTAVMRDIRAFQIDSTLPEMISLEDRNHSYLSDEYIQNQLKRSRYVATIMAREYLRGRPVETVTTFSSHGNAANREVTNRIPENTTPEQRKVFGRGVQLLISRQLGALGDRFSQGGDLTDEKKRGEFMGRGRGIDDHLDGVLSQVFYGFSGDAKVRYADDSAGVLKLGREGQGWLSKLQSESYSFGKALRAITDRDSQTMLVSMSELTAEMQEVIQRLLAREIEDLTTEAANSSQIDSVAQMLVDGWGVEALKMLPDEEKKALALEKGTEHFAKKAAENTVRVRDTAVTEIGRSISTTERKYNTNDQYRYPHFAQEMAKDTLSLGTIYGVGERFAYDAISQEIISKAFAGIPTSREVCTLQGEVSRGLAHLGKVDGGGLSDRAAETSQKVQDILFKLAFVRDVSGWYQGDQRDRDQAQQNLLAYITEGKKRGIDPVEMLSLHSSYLRARVEMLDQVRKAYPSTTRDTDPIQDILTPIVSKKANELGIRISDSETWYKAGVVKYTSESTYGTKTGIAAWEPTGRDQSREPFRWVGVEASNKLTKGLLQVLEVDDKLRAAATYDAVKATISTKLAEQANPRYLRLDDRDVSTVTNEKYKFDRAVKPVEVKVPGHFRANVAASEAYFASLKLPYDQSDGLTDLGRQARETKKEGPFGLKRTPTSNAEWAQSTMQADLRKIADHILQLRGETAPGDSVQHLRLDLKALETVKGINDLNARIAAEKDNYSRARREAAIKVIDTYRDAVMTPEQIAQLLLAQMFGIEQSTDIDAQISTLLTDPRKVAMLFNTPFQIESKAAVWQQMNSRGLERGAIQRAVAICGQLVDLYKDKMYATKENVLADFRGLDTNQAELRTAMNAYDAKIKGIDLALQKVAERLVGLVDKALEKRLAGQTPPDLASAVSASGLPPALVAEIDHYAIKH